MISSWAVVAGSLKPAHPKAFMSMDESVFTRRSKSTKSTLAGPVGAGGGTLLVLLANNLPTSSPGRSWLVLIAPSASVGLSAVFVFLRRYIGARMKDKHLKTLIQRARETLEVALRNPATSEEHRKALKSEQERLERLLVESDLSRIEALIKEVE
jgi:hypothetical protein